MSNDYPARNTLWEGAILTTIAHAIFTAHEPVLSYELSWEGATYNRQDTMGTRGAVTFAADKTIGLFFDENSTRSPFRSGEVYQPQMYLGQMPEPMSNLAQRETSQYLLDNYDGLTIPLFTACFWNVGDYLTSFEPWENVLKHGAHIIGIEAQSTADAIIALQDNYELSAVQHELLQILFHRRINSQALPITLDSKEQAALLSQGCDGIVECRDLLRQVSIYIEENVP